VVDPSSALGIKISRSFDLWPWWRWWILQLNQWETVCITRYKGPKLRFPFGRKKGVPTLFESKTLMEEKNARAQLI
jgi:hypothetical protein